MIITVTLNPALDKSLTVPRFAAGAVNRALEARLDPGGKGVNVSKVLRSLGDRPLATGFLGGAAGQALASALDHLGIRHRFIQVSGETRTNIKLYDPEWHTYTDINEPGSSVSAEAVESLFQLLLELARRGDTVLFAGSAPQGVAPDTTAHWASELLSRGVLVAADQDGAQLHAMISSHPSLIKPNEHELQELLHLPDTEIPTLCGAARSLVEGGIARVIVSLGEKGALFADGEGILFAEGVRVHAVSTVGAGDALTAGLLHAINHDFSREEAARFAIATATAKVTCPGSSPPDLKMIEQYLPQVKISQID
jgi:1-phosphofructokinase